jgi:hypothetical protein
MTQLPTIKGLWRWNATIVVIGWLAMSADSGMTMLIAVAITGLLSLLFSKRYYRLLGGLVCGFSIWCIVGENQRLEQRALRLERLQSAHEKAMMQNPGNQETNAPRSQETNAPRNQETNVFYQLTGQFFPTRKVEALHQPRQR